MNVRNNFRSQGLKLAYHLLYHQFAWTYDFVADIVSLGAWQDWVGSTLPHLAGPRVLELGFGPGHLQRWLTERGIATFGVDSSPQMARRAKKFSKKLSLADAQALPFPKNSFDQVVATFPSNTILSEHTLGEAKRVLEPAGKLIMLPVAWIKGKKLLEKSAAGLWRATKQASPWDDRFLERFTKVGFKARAEHITQKSWSLVIIVAEKP